MLPINDKHCGWLKDLPPRTIKPMLTSKVRCDWVVLGAGYTGLSAARKLAQLKPLDHILLVDANLAGEGASARNSGFLVDSTLNDGHLTDKSLENYLAKYHLLRAGMETVRDLVNEYRIDCDWNECGKYHATASELNLERLNRFSQTLVQCGITHDYINQDDLSRRLGSQFYKAAIHTQGGVLLHPAKLARGMVDILPSNVRLLENSPIQQWQKTNGQYEFITADGAIVSKNALICTNAFMPSLGIKQDRVFALTHSVSLTRRLTDLEFKSLQSPTEWGVLSAKPMGATVRFTQDHRLMIRNTTEPTHKHYFNDDELAVRKQSHLAGLQKRFPNLPDNVIQHTWAGVTGISRNSANIFAQLDKGLFAAGCYNGGGIGLATMFGEQLAFKACGIETPQIEQIAQRPQAKWLPPQPFLHWGVKAKLAKEKFSARSER